MLNLLLILSEKISYMSLMLSWYYYCNLYLYYSLYFHHYSDQKVHRIDTCKVNKINAANFGEQNVNTC